MDISFQNIFDCLYQLNKYIHQVLELQLHYLFINKIKTKQQNMHITKNKDYPIIYKEMIKSFHGKICWNIFNFFDCELS